MKKYCCEFLGTAILVFFGCGAASLVSNYIGTIGIALTFGLSFIVSASLISKISGCHINPAVSLAMFITKKISLKDLGGYIIAQILGAIVGCLLLGLIITSANIGNVDNIGLGANGYGILSSVNISLMGAILTEVILTFIFVLIVLRVTDQEKNINIYLIGLTLTLIHIIGIPLTGTSVNPARSLAPAILLGKESLKQVWVFIVSPLLGSLLASFVAQYLKTSKK